jgi:hypothetical protein
MTPTISYEPFEKLIVSLRNDGLLRESGLLDHMIHKVAWTTGSELIGELGKTIKEIRRTTLNKLSNESRERMKEAMEMVKQVWPDFPE